MGSLTSVFGKGAATTSKLSSNLLSKGSSAFSKASNTVSSSNLRTSQKFVPISTTADLPATASLGSPSSNNNNSSSVNNSTDSITKEFELFKDPSLNNSGAVSGAWSELF